MSSLPLWWAIRTLKSKIGTGVGLSNLRELMPEITDAQWARAVGEARASLALRTAELTRPLNRRPSGPLEILPRDTKGATGYWQSVDVYVRDNDTGTLEVRPYTIRTDTLRSRQSVVNEAKQRYQEAIDADPDNYPEEILGVAYTGTYELIPKVG
jgi:hypothetical protein